MVKKTTKKGLMVLHNARKKVTILDDVLAIMKKYANMVRQSLRIYFFSTGFLLRRNVL